MWQITFFVSKGPKENILEGENFSIDDFQMSKRHRSRFDLYLKIIIHKLVRKNYVEKDSAERCFKELQGKFLEGKNESCTGFFLRCTGQQNFIQKGGRK